MSSNRAPIAIVEYGMGNVQSVHSAFDLLGCHAVITDDPATLRAARALVIPGVGAFGQAMDNLKARNLLGPLNEEVRGRQKPVLGICLGMQLFADWSDEMGHHAGLGWIPGRVALIVAEKHGLSLPHVGWNNVRATDAASLFTRIPDGTHFYFDHSFEYSCDPIYVQATVEYGSTITAAVALGSILGVQFHPEKSQTNGLRLLRNFLNLVDRGPQVVTAKVAC
jgi:imidazole glycerol-phosphate synthase subunit HisH